MKVFELDIYPEYFNPVSTGIKTFEIRRDEGFKIGDMIVLNEYDPVIEKYTGRKLLKTIVYITDYAQKEPYVVLGIK